MSIMDMLKEDELEETCRERRAIAARQLPAIIALGDDRPLAQRPEWIRDCVALSLQFADELIRQTEDGEGIDA